MHNETDEEVRAQAHLNGVEARFNRRLKDLTHELKFTQEALRLVIDLLEKNDPDRARRVALKGLRRDVR